MLNVDGEVVVKLADGWTLRSGVYDQNDPEAYTSGEYVRLCDPNDVEYVYWDQEEWRNDPALVMGAIINSASGFRGLKERVKCEHCPLANEDDCKGYHYE
jgi:hypothetical protein